MAIFLLTKYLWFNKLLFNDTNLSVFAVMKPQRMILKNLCKYLTIASIKGGGWNGKFAKMS